MLAFTVSLHLEIRMLADFLGNIFKNLKLFRTKAQKTNVHLEEAFFDTQFESSVLLCASWHPIHTYLYGSTFTPYYYRYQFTSCIPF